MPETIETANEIVKIKHDIAEIKQSQEADMHIEREKYEKLVLDTIARNPIRIKVFLEVDGLKSRKEIQDIAGGKQATVWRAIDKLEENGLIIKLEQTKSGSPIYTKPKWVKTLRIDDCVRKNFSNQTSVPKI
ncbi:MAG: hypothetical protein M1371_10280 [Actinobacteria bacterium]|nr:hypothetical protein [Actinomycetota bacterium]